MNKIKPNPIPGVYGAPIRSIEFKAVAAYIEETENVAAEAAMIRNTIHDYFQNGDLTRGEAALLYHKLHDRARY